MSDEKEIYKILKQYFGYSEFKQGQKEVILSVLGGRDTLAVMPTGGGKSLCYQIPAIIFPGITIVVSPLISLMKDQVDAINSVGVEAVLLNSSLEKEEYYENMEKVRSGLVKLLYCAPETLVTDRVQNLLHEINVSAFIIDEAHCISEWGHDFRPEYRSIVNIRLLIKNAVCLALTATATKQVRQDILNCMEMKNCNVFVSSFNRENIFLEVTPKMPKKYGGGESQILDFINSRKDESGIIYCFSRKQVDVLVEFLCSNGINALPYHAGLKDYEREQNQTLFVRDKVPVMVATLAFGMGINKTNVRYVIHFDMPKSVEQYYQEIGRAGRDSEKAIALLLYSYSDTKKIQYFFKEKNGNELAVAQKQLQAMVSYCESTSCRRQYLLSYFGENYIFPKTGDENKKGCCSCDICTSGIEKDVDMTIPAQKFLSCIIRTGEKYGTSYIIDVLLGSKQKRILENGHDNLSTWGIGKEYSKDDWFSISKYLLAYEYIIKTEDYGVLVLTEIARDALRKRKTILLPFVHTTKKSFDFASETKVVTNIKIDDEQSKKIFNELKLMRKIIAEENNVPPYVIFSDKTLKDISIKKPKNIKELLNVYGIGEKKADSFGSRIVRIILEIIE